jgi:DICT domain-containing protein
MLDGLRAPLDAAEARRRSIEVFAASPALAETVADRFATKNVAVTHESLPSHTDDAFLVLRGDDGEFLGAIGHEVLARLLSPEIHPPLVLAETDVDYADVFAFLDDTLFSSFDRAQMLATAREIEERAWRVADGHLYVGFQRPAAYQSQATVYEHLADRGTLSVDVFVSGEWDVDVSPAVPVTVADAEEIGDYWFLAFDGGGSDMAKCALIAEEREEGRYYGFWTYDEELVDDIIEYLDTMYLDS